MGVSLVLEQASSGVHSDTRGLLSSPLLRKVSLPLLGCPEIRKVYWEYCESIFPNLLNVSFSYFFSLCFNYSLCSILFCIRFKCTAQWLDNHILCNEFNVPLLFRCLQGSVTPHLESLPFVRHFFVRAFVYLEAWGEWQKFPCSHCTDKNFKLVIINMQNYRKGNMDNKKRNKK